MRIFESVILRPGLCHDTKSTQCEPVEARPEVGEYILMVD